jgi:hypothetical protein
VNRAAARAAAVALLLALTACGASDDDKAAEAVAETFADGSDETFQVSQEQADCVGEGFVDEIGVDKLQEYGVITDDLETTRTVSVKMSKQDAEAAAKVLVDCTDANQLFRDVMLSGEELPEATQKCLDDALSEELIKDFFAATFTQDQAAASEAMTPLHECTVD